MLRSQALICPQCRPAVQSAVYQHGISNVLMLLQQNLDNLLDPRCERSIRRAAMWQLLTENPEAGLISSSVSLMQKGLTAALLISSEVTNETPMVPPGSGFGSTQGLCSYN